MGEVRWMGIVEGGREGQEMWMDVGNYIVFSTKLLGKRRRHDLSTNRRRSGKVRFVGLAPGGRDVCYNRVAKTK